MGDEVRGVFLDISKAFDKVWHGCVIFKLIQNSIPGKMLNILNDFLRNIKPRLVLNGQVSSWADVKAGFPQGSVLGPLPFLIHINDLPSDLTSNPKLFADDISVFEAVKDMTLTANEMNKYFLKKKRLRISMENELQSRS